MGYIVYRCCLVSLFLSSVYGEQCKVNGELYNGCPVYKCPKFLKTNDGEGNFLFYTKPFSIGYLYFSLYNSYSDISSTQIYKNLFIVSTEYKDINSWHKMKIKRKLSNNHSMPYSRDDIYTYSLEVNDKKIMDHLQPIEAGDEIHIQTYIRSLWSYPCGKAEYMSSTTPYSPSQTSSPSPLWHSSPSLPAEEDNGDTDTATFSIRGWHVAITGAIILALSLVVIQILRYKRIDHHPDLNQHTDQQSRLSQHV